MATASRPFTAESLAFPADRGAEWRRVPRVTREALALVWAASPRHMLTTIALQLVGASVIGGQLLVGRRLLQELVTMNRSGGSLAGLLPEFLVLIGVTVLGGVVTAVTAHQQRMLSELMGRLTFDRIIAVAGAVPLDAFETPDFYDQLARAKTSGLYKPIEMVNTIVTLSTATLTSAGVAVALFTLEPLLLPFILAAAIPLLVATLRNSRESYQFEYAMTPQSRERMYLMELLTGRETAKEIRVFGATRFLGERYDRLSDERVARLRQFLRGRLRVGLTGTVASAVGSAIALGSLAFFLADGRIGVPTAVAAGLAMQILAGRLSSITSGVGKLVEAGMFIDDFHAFLRLGEELAPDLPGRLTPGTVGEGPARDPQPFEGLALERVSFTYPNTDRPVLSDIDLRVEPGQIVALVGENGSGKSTLVKLICQLYRPQAGRVLWNGTDAAALSPADVRADMTVLFQDYIQYHLTARDNIALGRVDRAPDEDAIAAAARQGGADSFLSRLPHAYETRLGRQFFGGHELSIGQWQRLALARAFFRGGGFLVLDEPTASLDPRAEFELFQQVRSLAAGRSVLMVSHRFSSVRTADHIYVMRDGRIAEDGSHAELMAFGGHYAELFELQASAYLGEDRRTRSSATAIA